MNINVFKYTMAKKLKLVKEKGCKCQRCGVDLFQTPWLADFHHIDPSFKEFTISASSAGFSKLLQEADKCELVCCVCHRNLHFNMERFNQVKTELYQNIDEMFLTDKYFGTDDDKRKIIELHNKGYCQTEICQELFSDNRKQRHLVRRTLKSAGLVPNKAKTLLNSVAKDEIEQMLKDKKTAKQIADHYGMSKGNLFILLNKLNITSYRTNGHRPIRNPGAF